MKVQMAASFLAGAIVAGSLFVVSQVPAQGGLVKPRKIPTDLVRKQPEQPAKMVVEGLIDFNIAALISRKSAFKPLEGKLTLDPYRPIGVNGALFAQYVNGFNFVEGTLNFREKSGGVGVYFRPTREKAEYIAEFTIDVRQSEKLKIYAAGTDLKELENRAIPVFELTKGTHRLAVSVTANNRDFICAYLHAYEGGWWEMESVTVRKAD